MDLQLHVKKGWDATLKFIGPVLLITVVQLLVIMVSLGIFAPVVSAGYIQSLLRALREGRTPEVKDLFSEMSLFLPLFGFGLVVFLAICFGFLLLFLPGVALSLFVLFACLYLLPLMTDRRLGLFDALKCSWNMAVQDPIADHIIIVIVYAAIISLGGSLPFAIIVAQPLATFIFLSVYEERVVGQKSFIEEHAGVKEPEK